MRILRFIVDNETIKQDPECDFTGLFPGRNPDVEAVFEFSKEWDETIKVVAFWSMLDDEYEPQELIDDSCTIPKEALSRASFRIQVLGKKKKQTFGKTTLTTNKLTVRQMGGKR